MPASPASETERDAEYLGRLRDYYADARRIPSHQRIAALMGFASKTAARKLLGRLESAGFVERTPDDDAWMPTRRFLRVGRDSCEILEKLR